jgi:hypothetical protein
MLFKRKVTVADYCHEKLTRLFSQGREATWDNLRVQCNDPHLSQADRGAYYSNLRAVMIELMQIAVAKNCHWKSCSDSHAFVGDYLEKHGLEEINSLAGEYNRAFGTPSLDGVAVMVRLFAEKLTESKMGDPARQRFLAEFYAILRGLFEEFKSVKLIPTG